MADDITASSRVKFGLAADAVTIFIASSSVNVLSYALQFGMSHLLRVDVYGTFAALLSATVLILVPANIIATVIGREVATLSAIGDLPKASTIVRKSVGASLMLAAVVLVASIAASKPIAEFMKLDDPLLVIVTGATLAAWILLPVPRGALQGLQRFSLWGVSNVGEGILKLAFAVAAALAGLSLGWVFLGFIVSALLALGFTIWVLRRALPLRRTAAVLDVRRLMLAAGGVAVSTTCITALSYVDVVLMKHFAFAYQAGLYSALALSGRIVLFVGGFVPILIIPKAARWSAEKRPTLPMLWIGLAATLCACGVILVAYGFFPQIVMRAISGGRYVAAAPFVLPYGFAMAALAISSMVAAYGIGVHRFRYLYVLCAGVICEVAGIAVWHASIREVVEVMVVVNIVTAIAVTLAAVVQAHEAYSGGKFSKVGMGEHVTS